MYSIILYTIFRFFVFNNEIQAILHQNEEQGNSHLTYISSNVYYVFVIVLYNTLSQKSKL